MGTLTATPSIVTIFNVAAGPVSIAVTTTNNNGPISASLADGSFVTLSPASVTGSNATFTLTPTNVNGGDDVLTLSDGIVKLQVPIALGSSTAVQTPVTSSNTLANAIAYIRIIADSPTQPSDANIGILLNQAILQVNDELDAVLQTIQLPITFGTSTVTLPPDVMDIENLSYNTGDLNSSGSIPYPLVELGPIDFDNFNAGVGGSYGLTPSGPTLYYKRLSDDSGRIRLQFAPFPPPGFFIVTYHTRGSLYDLTNTGSVSNMDPSYFRLTCLLTAQDVCMKGRDLARANEFKTQYETLVAKKKISSGRRNNARQSVVRDVTSFGYEGLPTWWPN